MTHELGRMFGKLLILLQYGPVHTVRLVTIILIAPIICNLLPLCLRFYLAVKKLADRHWNVGKELKHWEKYREQLSNPVDNSPRLRLEDFGLQDVQLERIKNALEVAREVDIADIDQDGFIASHIGPINTLPGATKQQFLTRKRYDLKIATVDGYIAVKKDFKGDRIGFRNELRALYYLGRNGCNVPKILNVDFENYIIIYAYIPGKVLREELAKGGAIVRDRDADNDAKFRLLDRQANSFARIQEGLRVLNQTVSREWVNELFLELEKLHSARVIWSDLKYGNILIEETTGKPYFIDFDRAAYYPKLPESLFRLLRDRDIEKFNLHFASDKLTINGIANRIATSRKEKVYASAYFGSGQRIGKLLPNTTGYGRWHYILKRHLPSASGKRILDLGANNGFNAMQLLRCGAREVIGVELDEKAIAQGQFVKSAFEYFDNATYEFKHVQANMKETPNLELGNFDYVMALCSIYYLDDESIHKLANYVSTITDTFVLQADIATDADIARGGRKDSKTYEKATLDFALKILQTSGFRNTSVVSPYRYSRPLVIGTK